MARPAPERLLLATYPWSREVEPRFGDMDAQRHLNNVSIARLYEDARFRFSDACGLRAAMERGSGLVVAEVCIQYLGEGRYPEPLRIGCGVARVGTSSFTFAQSLFQEGRCIGTAEATLVHIDLRERSARPLPDGGRDVLLAHPLKPASALVDA